MTCGWGTRLPLVRLLRWNCRQRSQRYARNGKSARAATASASCSLAKRAFFLQILNLVRFIVTFRRRTRGFKDRFVGDCPEAEFSAEAVITCRGTVRMRSHHRHRPSHRDSLVRRDISVLCLPLARRCSRPSCLRAEEDGFSDRWQRLPRLLRQTLAVFLRKSSRCLQPCQSRPLLRCILPFVR